MNKAIGAGLFLAGVIVGINYPKIKKAVKPALKKVGEKSSDAYTAMTKFFVRQKERLVPAKATKGKARGKAANKFAEAEAQA